MSRLALLVVLLLTAAPLRAQVPAAEYAARRDSLAARLGPHTAVLAFGERAPIGFPAFYQVPNFRYLTGLLEPDAAFVLVHAGGRATGTLYRRPRDPRAALWDGALEDDAALARRTGLRTRPAETLDAAVDSLLRAGYTLYVAPDVRPYGYAADSLTRGAVYAEQLRDRYPEARVADAGPVLRALRARKSPAEQALLRRAVGITAEALRAAMQTIAPGTREYEVQATIEYIFRARGGDRPSFATNVSAGENTTILHHRAADDVLQAGAMVLMDVGAAYAGYAGDITRTVPVSGRFTPEQRAIYALVLEAQQTHERLVRPGASARAAAEAARTVRLNGLARLGLIESPDATFDPPWPADCAAQPASCQQGQLFMLHGTSHGIGLDVHDPTQFYADDTYRVGDAFTIEPGLYVSTRILELLPDTPKNRAFKAHVRPAVERFDHIGVRIEDDYLITPDGVERLSAGVPREVDAIEQLMATPLPAGPLPPR